MLQNSAPPGCGSTTQQAAKTPQSAFTPTCLGTSWGRTPGYAPAPRPQPPHVHGWRTSCWETLHRGCHAPRCARTGARSRHTPAHQGQCDVFFWGGGDWSRSKRQPGALIVNGESTTSLPVSRKERGTVSEGSHLLKTPLPTLPNKSCRTLRGVASWARVIACACRDLPDPGCAQCRACWSKLAALQPIGAKSSAQGPHQLDRCLPMCSCLERETSRTMKTSTTRGRFYNSLPSGQGAQLQTGLLLSSIIRNPVIPPSYRCVCGAAVVDTSRAHCHRDAHTPGQSSEGVSIFPSQSWGCGTTSSHPTTGSVTKQLHLPHS